MMTWVVAILAVVQVVLLVVFLRKTTKLRAVVERLGASANDSLEAAGVLQAAVEEVKRLDAEDRAELKRLLLLALQMSLAIGRGEAANKRIEDEQQSVKGAFAIARKLANEVVDGEAGAAADAAVKGGEADAQP